MGLLMLSLPWFGLCPTNSISMRMGRLSSITNLISLPFAKLLFRIHGLTNTSYELSKKLS